METSKKDIKIGILQYKNPISLEDTIDDWINERLGNFCSENVNIVMFPELFNLNYFCMTQEANNFDVASHISIIKDYVAQIYKTGWEVILVIPFFEKSDIKGVYYNSVAVFDTDGSLAGIHRKVHIPDDPGYNEKYYFKPGNKIEPIKTSICTLGIMICFDIWFPEMARELTLKGAEILICPSAIGWDPKDNYEEKMNQLDAWKTIHKSHSVANGVFTVAVNRIGTENVDKFSTHFWGNSAIYGTLGEEIASTVPALNYDNNGVGSSAVGMINLGDIEKTRRVWTFLRDRRPEIYNIL